MVSSISARGSFTAALGDDAHLRAGRRRQEADDRADPGTDRRRRAGTAAAHQADHRALTSAISRAAEEAKKVFAGDVYDESIIGSQDRETRRLVGAELL